MFALSTKAVGQHDIDTLVDDVTGDDVRPPGLRFGVAQTTASAATDGRTAMLADMSALAASIATINGTAPLAFAMWGPHAASASLLATSRPSDPGIGSGRGGVECGGGERTIKCLIRSPSAVVRLWSPEIAIN